MKRPLSSEEISNQEIKLSYFDEEIGSNGNVTVKISVSADNLI